MACGECAGLSGEVDLGHLITKMAPELQPARYTFRIAEEINPLAFAIIREDEGTTEIVSEREGGWARITLGIHSSLEAVGLTAAFSTALASAGISANVIAGFHHDHIFVPWSRRLDAMDVIGALARSGPKS
jgi:uncharacterized protein